MSICKCNSKNCQDTLKILALVDCKLAELGNNLYNNLSYLLNNNSDICTISKLIMYKRILLYKSNNQNYLKNWCLCNITNAIKHLTIGCIKKCCKPNCNEIIIINKEGIFTNEFNTVFQ